MGYAFCVSAKYYNELPFLDERRNKKNMNSAFAFINKIVIIIFCALNIVFAEGNINDYELGAAMYCELSTVSQLVEGHHWHAGVYLYFEYLGNEGYMSFSQQGGSSTSSNGVEVKKVSLGNDDIGINISKLSLLKNEFKKSFHGVGEYYGTYSKIILPNTLSLIASKAKKIGNWNDEDYHDGTIGYTWADMIDPNDYWNWFPPYCYEDWKGEVWNIDEIRCDGVVEFSYEYYDAMVANDRNIAEPGNINVDKHNDWHDGWADIYGSGAEICPRFQAGEPPCSYHPRYDYLNNNSQLSALTSSSPSVTNFSKQQFDENIQFNFKISDNASVKSYVMLQVKKSSESEWRLLIDDNEHLWKFRSVDLTDYDGSSQYDHFYIPWSGEYEGGYYSSGTHTFDLKITVIDQGANYCESIHNFTATFPALDLYISGPSSLNSNETGTLRANPSGGRRPYVFYEWWERDDREIFDPIASGGGDIEAPPGGLEWVELNDFDYEQEIQIARTYDFSLKCRVVDTQGGEAYDIHSINVGGGTNKTSDNLSLNTKQAIRIPKEIVLESNYPNPFNPSTTIKFGLPKDGNVKLSIYSINGRKIISLSDANFSAGFHEIKWNGKNNNGNLIANGFYIYELITGDRRLLKKMVFAK